MKNSERRGETGMAARRRASKAKPFWERGYNGHAYWQGKTKLGKVTLHTEKDAKAKLIAVEIVRKNPDQVGQFYQRALLFDLKGSD